MRVTTELFVDDAGNALEVHERTQACLDHGCVIHNPSDHPMRAFPLVWRKAGPWDIKPSHFERICPHGVGHPDPDALAYAERRGLHGLGVHGCDGCCK